MNYGAMKNILADYMYKDTACVTRQMGIVDEEGADDYELKEIYRDIPCKLSQSGRKNLTARKEDRSFILDNELTVCLAPEYEILPNDILTVQHEGQIFQLNAAKAFRYPTHQEILVKRREEA